MRKIYGIYNVWWGKLIRDNRCVIAELFLEGVSIFDLSQLLSYRKGEYNPLPVIQRIGDTHIENLIKHMIQRDPSSRLTAASYLANWYVLS